MRYIVLQCLLLPPRTSSFKMHAESLFKAKFRFGKEPYLHGHIFPFMCTSIPSWPHLPLHGHIFLHGTSSPSWAHLPLHGFIYLFMATSSPSWAHLPLRGHIHHGKAFCAEMVIVRLSFWLSFKTGNISGKINFMTSPPARSTGHLITFSCLAFRTESI